MSLLTLEQAQAAVNAALGRSKELGTKMNIAIVDAGADLTAFAREDGAWLGSIDIAVKKARTARFLRHADWRDRKALSARRIALQHRALQHRSDHLPGRHSAEDRRGRGARRHRGLRKHRGERPHGGRRRRLDGEVEKRDRARPVVEVVGERFDARELMADGASRAVVRPDPELVRVGGEAVRAAERKFRRDSSSRATRTFTNVLKPAPPISSR